MEMKRVLVTAIGSLSADIIIKVLHRTGYYVVGTDIYPGEWVVDSGNVDKFYRISRAAEQDAYVNQLLEICRKEKIDYIFPLTDAEIDVLNKSRGKFDSVSKLCISDYETICICRDKRKTTDIVGPKGICPMIPDYDIADLAKGSIPFPIISKPVDGRSSLGFKIFEEEEDFYRHCHRSDCKNYLFQPYIAGNVVTVDVVRDKKTGQCVAVARREMLRTPNGAGLSVQVFRDVQLEKDCAVLAGALGITGCVNFEFIETNEGIRYFLECNPRFSGGLEFSILSGYDFVSNHLRCFDDREIETDICVKERWIARKYEEYIMR